MEFSAQHIADLLQGEIIGNPSVTVSDFAKIEEGRPGTLSFLSNPKYESYLYTTASDIILVNKDFTPSTPVNATLIKVENAYESLARLLQLVEQQSPRKTGISTLASVDPTAEIGKDSMIHDFVFIGPRVKIGSGATIHPGVCIHADTIIGKNCTIKSNAVIGSDGFGFAPTNDGRYTRIPQRGNVMIGDDVEIGANTTIDRATFGSTIIGSGVKIDNLVQIAHNVEIGEHSVIASQTGIAGSSKIGKRVMFGGQVGITGHISIADGTILGAKAGVGSNIKEPGQIWSGTPAITLSNFRRSYVVNKNLPELQKNVTALLKKVEALEQQLQKQKTNS